MKNKNTMYLLIAPVLAYILIPQLERFSYSYITYKTLSIISLVATAISIGCLVYVVMRKDIKFNAIYQLPCLLGTIILYWGIITQNHGFIALRMIQAFKFLITGLAIYAADKLIKKDESKPLILLSVAFIMYYVVIKFLINALSVYDISFGLRSVITVDNFISLFVCVAAEYFVFKKYDGILPFQITLTASYIGVQNNPLSENPNAKYICPKCNRLFEEEAHFCEQCGSAVLKRCEICGAAVEPNDSFCGNCGNPLQDL